MLASLFAGFTLSFSLILAIGAQNAFVLKQGLRGEHVFWVCLFCACSDAILIILGIAGFNAVIQKLPWLEPLMRYGGAAFLFVYGARSFWAAFSTTEGLAKPGAWKILDGIIGVVMWFIAISLLIY